MTCGRTTGNYNSYLGFNPETDKLLSGKLSVSMDFLFSKIHRNFYAIREGGFLNRAVST